MAHRARSESTSTDEFDPGPVGGVREVAAACDKSRAWIYRTLARDPTFPRPFKPGPKENTWFMREVWRWLETRPRRFLPPEDAAE